MTTDISAEAVEAHAQDMLTMRCTAAAAALRALRAALDAAERERDEALGAEGLAITGMLDACRTGIKHLQQRDAADAAGYARGVREAAAEARALTDGWRNRQQRGGIAYGETIYAAILALLPKEPTP